MTRFIPHSIAILSVAGLISFVPLKATSNDVPDDQPKLSPEFVDRLDGAKNPSEQDKIIAERNPRTSAAEFRSQFLKHIYDVTLRGEYSHAAADCQLILRLATTADSGEDAAAARVHLGYILRESGDLAGSLDAISQALDFYTAHPEFIHGLIAAQQSRGITYLKQSDFAHALESFERALALSQKIGHREGIIPALNSIGEVYRGQGQPERALEYYDRARKQVGDDNAWNMAFIFNNIGMSYDAIGDFDRAIENIERARKVAERVNFQPRVETSLAILGDLELKWGRPERARENYAQSLRLARELRDVSGEAQATLGLAQVAQTQGDAEVAFARSQEAAELFRKVGERVSLAAALTVNGRSLCALRRDNEARKVFEAAIGAIEETRGQVAGGDVEREQFFEHEIAPYQELASLFVRQAKPEQALAMAERISARVLIDMTNGGRIDLAAVLTPQEEQRQRELEIKLAGAERELAHLRTAEKPDGQTVSAAQRTRDEIREALEEFEILTTSRHPELRRTAVPLPLNSTADLKPLLRDGQTILLRYLVTDEDSYLFLIRPAADGNQPQLTVKSLGKKRAELVRLTNDFRDRLAARSLTWEKPARELYDLLLRPIDQEIASSRSLVIVPDGPLWELPFHALENSADHPLLVDHSLRYAPSLTFLTRAPQTPPSASPERELLAFVNPALHDHEEENRTTKIALMSDNWQSLPQAEKQVPALEEIYPASDSDIFVGPAARESVFKQKAAEAAIVHFATHGVLDDRAPLYSYLLLSQVGLLPGEDGRLETRELMRLKLNARLAILCGCETARGQITAGEGMVGLSWGFMVAGCPATIVSQWKVDSASSTPLMVELHRRLHAGVENAEALRQASLKLREDPRYHHPFYWAPFVLIGR